MGRCPGWSESSLGAQSFCCFCCVANIFQISTVMTYIHLQVCKHYLSGPPPRVWQLSHHPGFVLLSSYAGSHVHLSTEKIIFSTGERGLMLKFWRKAKLTLGYLTENCSSKPSQTSGNSQSLVHADRLNQCRMCDSMERTNYSIQSFSK